ncbi:MAG: hypothetical protein E7218_02420 [Anaerofustis stercorihominis]|nr:hypothetical protein [Anaerofustis stercorihominis]
MKRIFILIMTILIIFSFCSCEKDLINDADTGEIIISGKKNNYTDGTYYSYFDHFDADGFCGVVRMQIKDSVINSVRFDYFNKESSSLSLTEDEKYAVRSAEFRAARKNLYTQTLSAQSTENIPTNNANKYTGDFLRLADNILSAAYIGADKIIISESSATYTQSMPLSDTIRATLQISYTSDKITDIRFDVTDQYYASLLTNEEICMNLFGLTTEQIKDKLPELMDRSAERKENTEVIYEKLFGVYNSLADRIMQMHIVPQFNVEELF